MMAKKKEELTRWHADQVRCNVYFNFRQEMIDYCKYDVALSKAAVAKPFRGDPFGHQPYCQKSQTQGHGQVNAQQVPVPFFFFFMLSSHPFSWFLLFLQFLG